jgi:hypothetical protein
MARYWKNDPACGSKNQIVFVGNVELKDPTVTGTAEPLLVIDVIARPGYELVEFHFITLELKIVGPKGARFVPHSTRSNYFWEVPDDPNAPPPVIWREKVIATEWLRTRCFHDKIDILSGQGNGTTFDVGIGGLPGGKALEFTAFASASETRVTNCKLTIADLKVGQRLAGYLS